MEREIKFRAWNGANMVYDVVPWQWDFVVSTMFSKCVESNGNGILGSGGSEAKFEVIGYSFKNLMQYTGFNIPQTNAEPVEVWQHDICYSDLWNQNVLIEFKNGMFGVDCDGGFMPIINCRLVKKVGNKYENPELLTQAPQ